MNSAVHHKTTTIFFVRHGVTDHTGKVMYGRLPGYKLNDEGKLQASQAADILQPFEVDLVVSSPMERAFETAKIIADSKNLEVFVNDIFTETDIGDLAGMQYEDCIKLDSWKELSDFPASYTFPNGESIVDMQLRMREGVEALVKENEGKKIVLVSHRDPLIALISFYLGMDLNHFQKVPFDPAAITKVDFIENNAYVRNINITSTLRMV